MMVKLRYSDLWATGCLLLFACAIAISIVSYFHAVGMTVYPTPTHSFMFGADHGSFIVGARTWPSWPVFVDFFRSTPGATIRMVENHFGFGYYSRHHYSLLRLPLWLCILALLGMCGLAGKWKRFTYRLPVPQI